MDLASKTSARGEKHNAKWDRQSRGTNWGIGSNVTGRGDDGEELVLLRGGRMYRDHVLIQRPIVVKNTFFVTVTSDDDDDDTDQLHVDPHPPTNKDQKRSPTRC